MKYWRDKAILVGILLFISTLSTILMGKVMEYGQLNTSSLINVVLIIAFIVLVIPSILGAVYIMIYSWLTNSGNETSDIFSALEPHAIGWAIVVIVLWLSQYLNIGIASIYTLIASRKTGNGIGLPLSPAAREKENERAEMAKALEEALTEKTNLEARVKARKQEK